MKRALSTMLAIIACFIMGVAVLPAAGCSYQIEKQIDGMIELERWFFTSGGISNVIDVDFPDKNVVFDCYADRGSFFNDKKTYEALPGSGFYWSRHDESEYVSSGKVFIKIFVKTANGIIAYGLIRVTFDMLSRYTAKVIRSVSIVNEKGEYSPISEKEANKRIEKYKV